MTTKRCRVLIGTVEAPSCDNADFTPLSARAGHAPGFIQAFPSESVTLQEDEAIRLSLAGVIEILPS
jgi:hypothetical protein